MSIKTIAESIRNARINANYTQLQAAKKLGMTDQAISNYEKGKNRIAVDILEELCKLYQVDTKDVLSSNYWEDDYLEDFKNANSEEERLKIFQRIGYCDPRIFYECQLLKKRYTFYSNCDDKFSQKERDHIKGYRQLDEFGRKTVDAVLDAELYRMQAQNQRLAAFGGDSPEISSISGVLPDEDSEV